MLPNIQILEKLVLEHHQQLLHEAEQRRLLRQSSQHHSGGVQHLLARLRKCFIIVNTQEVERTHEHFTDSIEEPGREPELQETRS